MLEFIVLGLVPGTHLQISFTVTLIILAIVSVIGLLLIISDRLWNTFVAIPKFFIIHLTKPFNLIQLSTYLRYSLHKAVARRV